MLVHIPNLSWLRRRSGCVKNLRRERERDGGEKAEKETEAKGQKRKSPKCTSLSHVDAAGYQNKHWCALCEIFASVVSQGNHYRASAKGQE